MENAPGPSACEVARKRARRANGFYLEHHYEDVRTDMRLAREEVFGPVLNVIHMSDLDHAIALANQSGFGNGASIFSGVAQPAGFKHRVKTA